MNIDNKWLEKEILNRFLAYIKIDTTSDRHIDAIPSTANQWELLNLLSEELKDLGVLDVVLNKNGYLIARIPSNIKKNKQPPVIGFMAHVDTSQDMSGKNIKPQIHSNYNSEAVTLGNGYTLDPREFPDLLKYKGETIITSDGTTLLGADDKAGVAEIMTAVKWMNEHPDFSHGTVEIIFTPDEETGKGMDLFPVKMLESNYCYTMDGGGEGIIEAECFNAYKVIVNFTGIVIHLGSGRGKLVNAVSMAGTFLDMLPKSESPEATDGRYGYYCPIEIKGSLDSAFIELYLRDFETEDMERRVKTVKAMAAAVEGIYPGGKVSVSYEKQYENMRVFLDKNPAGLRLLKSAVELSGAVWEPEIIRGGTDGARLGEMGIPAPNVFTGGYNYHSRFEWAALSSMTKASGTIINLIMLWGEQELL